MALVSSVSKLLLGRAQGLSRFGASIKYASTGSIFEFIIAETKGEKKNVGLITLNKPKVHNTFCCKTLDELGYAIDDFSSDDRIGAIVITGNEKIFSAGVDIKEIFSGSNTFSRLVRNRSVNDWDAVPRCNKPVIAAVNGFALGAGCELAMVCDIVYAGDKAKFGLPEILIGTIPGAGGSQRLPRCIGKSKTMEMILTGDPITAQEAERAGLVSKVFPADQLVSEAVKLAEKIASYSQLIAAMSKEIVNAAFETSLQEGLHFEKRMFHATFTTEDQKEGITAFIEKRPPNFTNK